MNERREDQELEAYLAGDSALSRQYAELPDAQPPPELDARILAAAEAELKVVPLGKPWQRWTAAVGVAATVMLAFTLVMQLVIDTTGEPGPGVPPAAVVFMDEAEPEQGLMPEKAKAPVAAGAMETDAAPAFSTGRATGEAAKSLQREELVSTGRQNGRAGPGPDFAMPATPAPTRAAPGAVAGRTLNRAAPAAIADPRLARAVALIRELGAADTDREVALPAEARRRADAANADSPAADALEASTPQGQLDEVLRRYDAGDFAAAAKLLDEFLAAYPQHPVSRRLANPLD